MRRTINAVAVLLTAAAMTSGCGLLRRDTRSYEVQMFVTGTAAEEISWSVPDDQVTTRGKDLPHPNLPWTSDKLVATVKKTGDLTLRVMPRGGPAACRIVVEDKEVSRKQGPPGAELTCSTKLDGVD
jgi:hypothetical protein